MSNAINQIQGLPQAGGIAPRPKQPQSPEQLNFSRHLSERIERRRLDLSAERMTRLNSAVDKAAGKGSRDSVVFLDELALLVNVPSRTVLTAMQTDKMKDGVFTNIDSVVVG